MIISKQEYTFNPTIVQLIRIEIINKYVDENFQSYNSSINTTKPVEINMIGIN
jgi:hypothetical protein